MGTLYFSRSLGCYFCIWKLFLIVLCLAFGAFCKLHMNFVPFLSTSNIFSYFTCQEKKNPFDETNHKHFLIDLNK